MVGYDPENREVLSELLASCRQAIERVNGKFLYRYTSLKAGQIRSSEFALWESLGFQAEPTFQALVCMKLCNWNPPLIELDVQNSSFTEINIPAILLADNQEALAHRFKEEFQPSSPNQVCLTLTSPDGEVQALSYYFVEKYEEKGQTNLGAWSVGFHFRPQYMLKRNVDVYGNLKLVH